MRYFDFSTWKLTEPIEVIIKDDITYEKLSDIILKHYPNLENKENIQIIKLTGGYKIYLDTMLKFKPYPLIEYLDSKIDKFPLFLNNEGKMLIIKDKRIEAAEPSEEIKKYGFEPLQENKNTQYINNANNENNYVHSNGKVQQMIEMFNKGEFDPASKTHKDPNYKSNTKRVKEKGISIKIKMLEKDEEKNENKNDKNENDNKNNENNMDKIKVNEEGKKEDDEIGYFDDTIGLDPLF